ncbi:MAG: hypothetical protein KME17_12225 [Cyanosarcina radialis HA8281-LM2]|jgi:hypothetical protein|nr:hypothetical protein [Cyanosarcina radialis HA8281-LM2]
MKSDRGFIVTKMWSSRIGILAILAGLLAACNTTPNNPDVVVVNPNTPAVTPTPVPTPPDTVVSPIPQQPVPESTTVIVTPTTPTSPTTTGVVIQEPITDVVVITTYPNKESLVNKRVLFTETKVLNVVGDRPFWVGRSNNERLAVVLDPALDKGSAEKKIVVRAGQTLDLAGVLQPMPSAETAQKQWGLSATEAQQLQSEVVYLQADKIDFK